MKNTILQGNSLDVLKTLEENSVDSIVTDPPYGLSFMGKKWDYDVPSKELWVEAMRVLKPGGHLLSFAGSRTYHRMAVNIEDAGFEIRDQIMWVYGSGFPKSHNLGKSVNSLETKEWSKISNALDNIDQKTIIELWKDNSNNVNIVETQSKKNQTETGTCMPKNVFVQLNVVEKTNQENKNVNVLTAEVSFCEALQSPQDTNQPTATQNVEVNTIQSQKGAKFVGRLSLDRNHKSWSIFTAECNVREWLNENTTVNLKVDEALKTLRGNQKYSNEEITNVLYVLLTDTLKLTILNQSKTFQSLDTNSQMECVSATNVIITEYIMERLISNTVDILKSKAVDKLQGNEREVTEGGQVAVGLGGERMDGGKANPDYKYTKGTSPYEGWGTALKPSHEPICMARKPLSESTIAENVLAWGTGGINIDGCRVASEDDLSKRYKSSFQEGNSQFVSETATHSGNRMEIKAPEATALGRFPANFIHDGSDEVVGLFPDTKSGSKPCHKGKSILGSEHGETSQIIENAYGDSGSASRFFYCAKASKKDRNEGLPEGETSTHPTVKPTSLMQYLVRMFTPVGGICLDPFMGSGSTGKACVLEGFDFIGIEISEEYCKIAEARINSVKKD